MLFTLKKVIGNMLLPLPLMLLIIGAGLALLWFSRFQKTGKIFISIGWLALLLLSLQPVADRLLRPIESTYPTWNNSQKVDYIVVLGGGYTWNPQWAPSSNLINNSLPRLNEGIRLWRENPGSKLIFTGGVAKTNTVSTAEVGARVAQSLGGPREQIITLDLPKDTEEEAAAAIAAFRKLRREIIFMVFIAVAPSLERAACKIKTRSTCGTGFCSHITKRPCPCVFIHKDRVEKFESAVPPCLLRSSSHHGKLQEPLNGEPTLPCPVTEASVPSY